MNQITEKIINLLQENGIEKNHYLDTLSKCYHDIQMTLWERISISPSNFYNLKDIIWYNLEHLPNGGETKGLSDLRFLGTKYPALIYCCNDTDIVSNQNVVSLLEEIESIINQWNKDWALVSLYTKSELGWNGGDNPSKVVIYDARTESPSKYGYNTNYGNIVGADGKIIKKLDIDTVLCAVDGFKIGEYVNGQILYNVLIKMREVCKKAIKNGKDIKFDFERIDGEF